MIERDIELARQAGLVLVPNANPLSMQGLVTELQKYTDIIRADEREAIALLSEQRVWAGKEFADAIRARGNT